MKRVIAGVILGVITFMIILYMQYTIVMNEYKDYQIIAYTVENKSYRLLVADRPDKWEKGLMNYRKLEGVNGMIFLFPDEQIRNFWNKNTLMDLTLYWIDKGRVIGEADLPSIKKTVEVMTVTSPDKADTVVELTKKRM